ncbi:DUF3152 domain-containing protein [Streptomyces sp. NRRL S-118]|uniref:DUF3152 domain-containing protein n=1 Tax=Streptomyces sp. NRRL S-118 TaxID=1463881 RepID=UPI000B083A4B|nr:DUF3152 domain-containing protein [Streptomyces sp. NRRL S-118]
MGKRRKGRRRTPTALLTLALAATCLGGGALLAHRQGDGEPAAAGPLAPPAAPPPGARDVEPEPERSASGPPPRGSRDAPPRDAPPAVPTSGDGTFTTARTTGDRTGSGPLRRYQVQVEDGTGLSAAQTAGEIQRILAHPRGWAAHGRGSFQLVTEDPDFVIRIATPDTADALCRAEGLDTGGELNCETRDGVVVNLKRWTLGSPTFSGPPAEYRHLIINHEIGHEIGLREHLGCSGPGRPAPVMMQQIKGLDGCRSNAWPYAEDGRYITGPVVS